MISALRRSLNATCLRLFHRNKIAVLIATMVVFSAFFLEFGNESHFVFGAKRESSKTDDVFFSQVSFEIEGVKLIDFLENYSETYGFSFFLDRRVDPLTPLAGSCADKPFIQALDELLGAAHLSFLIVDNSSLLYVGPQEAAGEALLLLARKNERIGLENAPKQTIERLFTPIDFQINPYSEPKDVFKSLAQRTRLKLSGFEKTPFDLYRGVRFEKVYAGSVLTILGLGFNVDYRYDDATASFKPVSIDKNAEVSRRYPEETTNNLKREDYPDCAFEKTTFDGKKAIQVVGPFKTVAKIELFASRSARDHTETSEQSSDSIVKASSKGTNAKQTRISGEINNATLRSLFDYLQKNANVKCRLDAALEANGITLDSRVSCRFTNADIHQIGSVIAKQINATSDINGNVITFRPK